MASFRQDTVWELLDQSQLISSPFALHSQAPCVDQTLNPDRCPPVLVHGIPLGPNEMCVPFRRGKVHVLLVMKQCGPNLPSWGVTSDFQLFDFPTGARYRDKLSAADSVSSRLEEARAVQLGLWVGLVPQERLAKSHPEGGNQSALGKTET